MPTKICPGCEKKIDAEDKFCRYCGIFLGPGVAERYVCQTCGHLDYTDLVQPPVEEEIKEKLKSCPRCGKGLYWKRGGGKQ